MTGAYRITVKGHLSDRWSRSFGDLEMKRMPDGTTVLSGSGVDQAQLHGILARIRDLAIPLLSVTPRPDVEAEDRPQGGKASQ